MTVCTIGNIILSIEKEQRFTNNKKNMFSLQINKNTIIS